jgi:proline dehydrogenase
VKWFNSAIAAVLPYVPKPLVWRVSRRYIAGQSLGDAFTVIQKLNELGMQATLDVLGEDVSEPGQVDQYRALYLEALEQIESQGLKCGISVKLSEMGLRFDPTLCDDVMEELTSVAEQRHRFLRIDMEDSSVTDATLGVYRRLRQNHSKVGAVIQACLRRSRDDIDQLLSENIANVRLCKGIYLEPPDLAFQSNEEINHSFNQLLDGLLAGGAEHIAIATHHPQLIEHALEALKHHAVDRDRYEFQMLLGVAERTRDRLVADGHPMRVYVPFGEHWFAYSTRRLRENPEVAGHVMRNLFSSN